MTRDEERGRLEAIEREARALLASADPLLRSQYAHLLGRVSALLAIVREGAPDSPGAGRRDSPAPGDGRRGQA